MGGGGAEYGFGLRGETVVGQLRDGAMSETAPAVDVRHAAHEHNKEKKKYSLGGRLRERHLLLLA